MELGAEYNYKRDSRDVKDIIQEYKPYEYFALY